MGLENYRGFQLGIIFSFYNQRKFFLYDILFVSSYLKVLRKMKLKFGCIDFLEVYVMIQKG